MSKAIPPIRDGIRGHQVPCVVHYSTQPPSEQVLKCLCQHLETRGAPPPRPDRSGAKRKAPGNGLFSTPSRPGSIVGAEAFHFRVRDGNGWFHLALVTRSLTYAVVDPGDGLAAIPRTARVGSGGGTRTHDLRVMSPASCRCSTPRRDPASLPGKDSGSRKRVMN